MVASNGEDFLTKMDALGDENRPHIMITDIHMPGMTGIDLVQHIKTIHPQIKSIMLSVSDEDELIYQAIQAGASGYLLKSEPVALIKEHIMKLSNAHGAPMSPEVSTKVIDLLSKLERERPQSMSQSLREKYQLTRREEEVLGLLVDGNDYREIAKTMHISPHTVRTHISNLYSKLHVSSKAQAIKLMLSTTTSKQPIIDKAKRHRIMLVDDHQLVLDSLSMMLSAQSKYFIAKTCNDPTSVAEYLSEHPIDLVISDINMPGLNGIDLAKRIKSQFPDVKILLLTVSDDLEEIQSAFEVGVDGYILKKTGKKELTAAIDSVLAGNSHFGAFLPAV